MDDTRPWSRAIMIVEDDPLIGELLTLRLEAARFKVTWVEDGASALNRIGEVKPQLVVLDLGLPVVDGFQVLQTLRINWRYRALPIIVLTARQGAEDVKRALALGATDYLAKPFDADALVRRIELRLLPPTKKADSSRRWAS